MIKIDVQGAEHQVLTGFGHHLDHVLAIELEAHFYPIYKDEVLLGGLVEMLAGHGLRLRRVTPQLNFDRDFLEVNAFFTREGDLPPERARMLDLIHQLLDLPVHPGGAYLKNLFSAPG